MRARDRAQRELRARSFLPRDWVEPRRSPRGGSQSDRDGVAPQSPRSPDLHLARQQGPGALSSEALRRGDRDRVVGSPRPAHAYGSLVLAASYAQLGRDEEASSALADIRPLPGGNASITRSYLDRYSDPVAREHMAEGLRNAGLLEQ